MAGCAFVKLALVDSVMAMRAKAVQGKGGEACQDLHRPLLDHWIRSDGHAGCAAQRSAVDRA